MFVNGAERKRKFPISVRSIRENAVLHVGDFEQHVAHEIIINLESFELPGTAQSVVFRFINPLWAWVMAANKMHMQGHEMFFSPKSMFDEETGDRLYGAGVSFGEKLKLAAARTPVGGKPALFGLR